MPDSLTNDISISYTWIDVAKPSVSDKEDLAKLKLTISQSTQVLGLGYGACKEGYLRLLDRLVVARGASITPRRC